MSVSTTKVCQHKQDAANSQLLLGGRLLHNWQNGLVMLLAAR